MNALAYNLKFVYSNLTDSQLKTLNLEKYLAMSDYSRGEAEQIRKGRKDMELPTLVQYAAKTPLLFVADPWQRWLVLWENDLDFLAECVKIPLTDQ